MRSPAFAVRVEAQQKRTSDIDVLPEISIASSENAVTIPISERIRAYGSWQAFAQSNPHSNPKAARINFAFSNARNNAGNTRCDSPYQCGGPEILAARTTVDLRHSPQKYLPINDSHAPLDAATTSAWASSRKSARHPRAGSWLSIIR